MHVVMDDRPGPDGEPRPRILRRTNDALRPPLLIDPPAAALSEVDPVSAARGRPGTPWLVFIDPTKAALNHPAR